MHLKKLISAWELVLTFFGIAIFSKLFLLNIAVEAGVLRKYQNYENQPYENVQSSPNKALADAYYAADENLDPQRTPKTPSPVYGNIEQDERIFDSIKAISSTIADRGFENTYSDSYGRRVLRPIQIYDTATLSDLDRSHANRSEIYEGRNIDDVQAIKPTVYGDDLWSKNPLHAKPVENDTDFDRVSDASVGNIPFPLEYPAKGLAELKNSDMRFEGSEQIVNAPSEAWLDDFRGTGGFDLTMGNVHNTERYNGIDMSLQNVVGQGSPEYIIDKQVLEDITPQNVPILSFDDNTAEVETETEIQEYDENLTREHIGEKKSFNADKFQIDLQTDPSKSGLNMRIHSHPEANINIRIERKTLTNSTTTMGSSEPGAISVRSAIKKAVLNSIDDTLVAENRKVVELEENATLPQNASQGYGYVLEWFYPNFKSIQNGSVSGVDGKLKNGSFRMGYLSHIEIGKQVAGADLPGSGVFYVGGENAEAHRQILSTCDKVFMFFKDHPIIANFSLVLGLLLLLLLLIGIFCLGKWRGKVAIMAKKEPEYKILKNRRCLTGGKVKYGFEVSGPSPDATKLHLKRHKALELIDSFMGKAKAAVRKDEKSSESSSDDEASIFERVRRLSTWVQHRISRALYPELAAFDQEMMKKKEAAKPIRRKVSEVDKTYTKKRQRLLKFAKRHLKSPKKIVTKVKKEPIPDIAQVISRLPISSDEASPASNTSLLQRIVATGEVKKIDDMLVGPDWDKSFYTGHGVETLADMDDESLKAYKPDERETLDDLKVMSSEAQMLGTLSRTSSTHSLQDAIGKSIRKAEYSMPKASFSRSTRRYL